jgi:hypothetical protein
MRALAAFDEERIATHAAKGSHRGIYATGQNLLRVFEHGA